MLIKTLRTLAILGVILLKSSPLLALTQEIKNPANAAADASALLEECQSMVKNLGDEAIKTLKGSKQNRRAREEQFRPLFVKNFDVEKIGMFVLGKYARNHIKPEEFQEFLDIFQKTIVSIYANRLGNYDDEVLSVKEAVFRINKPEEKIAEVKSLVISKNRDPINIVWTIVLKDGRKGIVDVSIENVSQAFTQRQEYADVLNNGGISDLIKRLKTKYAETIKK